MTKIVLEQLIHFAKSNGMIEDCFIDVIEAVKEEAEEHEMSITDYLRIYY